MTRPAPPPFTATERGFLRQAFGGGFGLAPLLTDGVSLPVWRTGPHRGEPKLPPAVVTLVARGLMDVPHDHTGARATFTELGLHAMRRLAEDGQSLDPERFGHVYDQLGLDRPDPSGPGQET